MNIKIEGAYGEHGELMTLFCDNELVASVDIDGSNDCPESLLDYLNEFHVTPERLGTITLEQANADVTHESDLKNGTLVWIVK